MNTVKRLSPELCQQNPDTLYVFGDNLIARGKGGQAIIRDEPNAFGIPTKRLPSMKNDAFFSDTDEELEAVKKRLTTLKSMRDMGTKIIFPEAPVGSGLSEMPKRSPKIYAYIIETINNEF